MLRLAGAGALTPALGALAHSRADEPTAALVAGPAVLTAERLSWAGVRLRAATSEVYIDPLLDAGVWGAALRPAPSAGAGARTRFVLVTHLHPDHFDPSAARRVLGEDGTLVCDATVAADAAARGFRVRSVRCFEPVFLSSDFTVTAVPAVDGYGAPQVSWVIAGPDRRVIHCGDTLWHGLWWQLGRMLGPFDAAFLPINGARFRWRTPYAEVPSVMTATQAVAAAVVLGARRLVPIHYGVRGADGYEEDPDALATVEHLGRERGLEVQPLTPGEWIRW